MNRINKKSVSVYRDTLVTKTFNIENNFNYKDPSMRNAEINAKDQEEAFADAIKQGLMNAKQ